MFVYAFMDVMHSHSVFAEDFPEDDPGTPLFRTLDQAKEYAQNWLNEARAAQGKRALTIKWHESDGPGSKPCYSPANEPDPFLYFQIWQVPHEGEIEEYFQHYGR